MEGKKNLHEILRSLNPVLNEGSYVFCQVENEHEASLSEAIFMFREKEGLTLVYRKEVAEELGLIFTYISS